MMYDAEEKCQFHSKWFEPRSISSSYSMIVRVSVVLRRTVVGDLLATNRLTKPRL